MIHSSAGRTAGFTNAEKEENRSSNATAANAEGVENHKKAAEHFAKAAEQHYQAARYHGEGNHALANECALRATGHSILAESFQRLDAEALAAEEQV